MRRIVSFFVLVALGLFCVEYHTVTIVLSLRQQVHIKTTLFKYLFFAAAGVQLFFIFRNNQRHIMKQREMIDTIGEKEKCR